MNAAEKIEITFDFEAIMTLRKFVELAEGKWNWDVLQPMKGDSMRQCAIYQEESVTGVLFQVSVPIWSKSEAEKLAGAQYKFGFIPCASLLWFTLDLNFVSYDAPFAMTNTVSAQSLRTAAEEGQLTTATFVFTEGMRIRACRSMSLKARWRNRLGTALSELPAICSKMELDKATQQGMQLMSTREMSAQSDSMVGERYWEHTVS